MGIFDFSEKECSIIIHCWFISIGDWNKNVDNGICLSNDVYKQNGYNRMMIEDWWILVLCKSIADILIYWNRVLIVFILIYIYIYLYLFIYCYDSDIVTNMKQYNCQHFFHTEQATTLDYIMPMINLERAKQSQLIKNNHLV